MNTHGMDRKATAKTSKLKIFIIKLIIFQGLELNTFCLQLLCFCCCFFSSGHTIM